MPKHNGKKKQLAPTNQLNANSVSTAESSRDDQLYAAEYSKPPGNIIVEQNEEIRRQDEQLVDLEASIVNLRDASLTINQEVSLQNRLLEVVHESVDRVQERQLGTQDRLRNVMRNSGTCKLWMLIIFLTVVLVIVLVALK
jgi:hypothetical protein